MGQIDVWFEQMLELRKKTISYTQLTRTLVVKPPVRKVCQLLGVNTLAEICTEDLLYRTIVRVAQMQAEEKEVAEAEAEVLDVTSLKPAPSLGDTILSIPPPIPTDDTIIPNIIQTLKRPATLTALLDVVKKSETLGKDRYSRFISLADDAHVEMTKSGVIHIAPKFMSTDAKPEKQVTTTAAIREIFDKYCIIKTFKEKIETRGTPEMSLKAVMAFCRDFDVYPKLVTKDEIRLILSVMDVRNARKGLKKLKGALEFCHFLDFLVRLALFAYHKPSTKAFILKLNNERLPSNLEMVDYLCQYLHFDDIKWVRERLQSTEIVVELCGFGNDENHKPTKTNPKHTVRSATPRDNVVHGHYGPVDITTMPFLLERERQNASLEGIKTKPRPKPFPSQVESLFAKHAERVRAEAADDDDDRDEHVSVSIRSGQGMASLQGSVAGVNKSQSGSIVGTSSVTGPLSTHASNHNKPPPAALDLSHVALSKPGKSNVDWNIASDTGTVNVTEEQRMLINGELDLALRQSIERYTHQKDMKPSSTLWHSSQGCFMDMGRLVKGSEIEIQLVVTNCSSDHIYLDTTCKGFDAPDTRVVTKPCSVAPGLNRTVSILFTVQPGDRATLGSIQVFVASVRTGLGHVFDVPSHYRVGPPHPETDGFLCTMNNLEMLKRRYLAAAEDTGTITGGFGTMIDPTNTRLVRPFDTHRTNQQVKERTIMYDITKFPKIMNDATLGTQGTYSTLFSTRLHEM